MTREDYNVSMTPIWLAKLVWRFRRKRVVRLHLRDVEQSFEGVLFGRWDSHYVLYAPKMVQMLAGDAEEQTVALDGHIEVPADRVLFLQFASGGKF